MEAGAQRERDNDGGRGRAERKCTGVIFDLPLASGGPPRHLISRSLHLTLDHKPAPDLSGRRRNTINKSRYCM